MSRKVLVKLQVRVWCAVVILCPFFSRAAFGQAIPAAEASPISTGFSLPTKSGELRYGVSASESVVWGYSGSGATSYSNLTGDLGFISSSQRDPFSVVLAGGRAWNTSGQSGYGFASLALSQVINVGRWNFVGADAVSYLPQSPTSGLTGLAGLGDLGLVPIQTGVQSGQSPLTNYANRVDNTASGSVQRAITGKTSVNASGDYELVRFVNNSNATSSAVGLDVDGWEANGALTHQYSVRNALTGNYGYSSYTYNYAGLNGLLPNFTSQTASLAYSHQFTRRLKVSAAAGPQWTMVSYLNNSTSLNMFAQFSASYGGEFSGLSAAYVRGTNSGYGVIAGARSDSVSVNYSRILGRVWAAAASAGYTRSSSLPAFGILPFSFDTTVFGVQGSRAIGHSLSAYASYTLEDQSSSGFFSNLAVNSYSGTSHILGFGLTYSPTAIHIGRR